MSTHLNYEQVCPSDAPLELRRDLFPEVTKQWDMISIPADILDPGSIPRMEQILTRLRP
jgi:hypothetical protein